MIPRGVALALLTGLGMLASASGMAQTAAIPAPAVTEGKAKEAVPVDPKAAVEPAKEEEAKAEDKSGVTSLLSEEGLENFYSWIAGAGVFVDPKGVFSVTEGVLRISGEKLGYLATRKEHSDFRLVAEYKWGEGKFGDRSQKPRSSGLFIHGTGEDKEWMRGFESQIAEGRTGNVVIHGGARFTVGTNNHSRAWTEIGKPKQELENKLGEWNTLEIFGVGDKMRVLVNGKLSVEATSLLPNRGKILLQSNGAEIFFRKLDLYPLDKMPELPKESASVPAEQKTAAVQAVK
ncbi:MAG: hypothetical protein K0Q55_2 [Verrucomicrobia bacterium]|jgi:hypothetical protein|nr:hypothetical protein [Verrucomicrobiota bacterium]